jgi:hypothetical protein
MSEIKFFLESVGFYPKVRLGPLNYGANLLGSGPTCCLNIQNPYCSYYHCIIRTEMERIFIKDLNSNYGTYLNGVYIQSLREHEITPNSLIGFGPMGTRESIWSIKVVIEILDHTPQPEIQQLNEEIKRLQLEKQQLIESHKSELQRMRDWVRALQIKNHQLRLRIECAVCKSSTIGEVLNCGHGFCKECLLENGERKIHFCPLCLKKIENTRVIFI